MVERDIVVSGSFNTRDLGGYRTKHGTLAWRKTFRSGNMGHVGPSGIATLKQLGVTRVIDLRSQKERDADPDPFRPDDGIELIAISLFDDLNPHQQPHGNQLLDLYLGALETQGPVFADVLRKIGESREAVLFHCTAGKDRTGWAAALLLAALGVDEEQIMHDYLLTNRLFRRPPLPHTRMSEEVLDVLWRVQPSYLAASVDLVRAQWGGMDRYLREALGVDEAVRERLAAKYLQG